MKTSELKNIIRSVLKEQSTNACQDFFDEMSPSMAGHWNPANGPIQPGSNAVPHGDIDCCEMYKGNHGPVFIGNGNTNDTIMNRLCTKAFNNITGQNFDEDTQEWAKCCRGEGITPTGDDPCEEFNAQTPQWQADCCKNPSCPQNPQCCPGGTTGTTTGTGIGTVGDREPIDREPSDRTPKKPLRESKMYYVDSVDEIKMIEDALNEEEEEIEEGRKKGKCKPSKGKRFAKRVDGKCRSFGQKGKASDGGDRIRPGTKKAHAYCARSAKIKKCKNPPCANTLSRRKWKCQGSRSVPESIEPTIDILMEIAAGNIVERIKRNIR